MEPNIPQNHRHDLHFSGVFSRPLLLNWTQSSNVSGYAIADGFIRFVSPRISVDKYAKLELLMGEETKHIRALADKVSSLATLEFKNMVAGGREVMLAIPRLTTLPRFDWTTCITPDCATMSTHAKERDKAAAAAARIGFDATTTPWTLPPIDLVSPKVQDGLEYVGTGSKRKREEEIGDQTMDQASCSPGILSLTRPQGPEPLATSKTPKRTQGSEPRRSSRLRTKTPSSMPPPPLPVGAQAEAAVPRKSRTRKRLQDLGGLFIHAATPPGRSSGGGRYSNGKWNAEAASRQDLGGLFIHAATPPGRSSGEAAIPRESGTRKGKGQRKAQGGDDNDVKDLSYRDNHDLSALYIVQQAWAQATRADSSIIVLQSANHEFIGIRHRGTRTLYMSDLITPHACQEPAYGKLHVGLYMAAVQDAIDRERQRAAGNGDGPDGGGPSGDFSSGGRGYGGDSSGGGPSGDPSSGGPGYSGGSSGAPGQGSNGMPKEGGSTEGGDTIAAHEMAAKETWEVAGHRNVILVYHQYGVYDSPAPCTFVRSGPTGQAPITLPLRETVRRYKLEECLSIVLKSEIGHGATGEGLRGTLVVEASACVQLDVAVKLAFASEQRDAIRNEYKCIIC